MAFSVFKMKKPMSKATPEELAAPDPHPVTRSAKFLENSKWTIRKDFVTMVTERYLDRLVETGLFDINEVCAIMKREAAARNLVFEGTFTFTRGPNYKGGWLDE